MTTQSDTQKELKKILYQHFFWLSPDINYTEVTQQILDLFKRMAKECVGQTSVASYKSVYPTWADGFKECSNRTHKNIGEKFR